MLIEAEAAEQVIAEVRAEQRGVVRMSCPTGLLSFQFGGLVARFMMQYAGVQVHLESTNRRVDVIAEGFDLAIRVRLPPLEPTDLVKIGRASCRERVCQYVKMSVVAVS